MPESDGDDGSGDDSNDDDDVVDDVDDNASGKCEEVVPQGIVSLSSEEMDNHLSRLEKVKTQVLVLVSQKKKSGVFTCKSSNRTGKKYLVRIKSIASCTCLDYEKVHLFFMNSYLYNIELQHNVYYLKHT